MLESIERLDQYLIDRWFEPAAHWVQRRTGYSCFRLAWLLLGITIVGYLAGLNLDIQKHGFSDGRVIFNLFLVPLLVILLSFRLTMLERRDRDGWKSTMNPARLGPGAFMRVTILVFVATTDAIGVMLVLNGQSPWLEQLIGRWPLTTWIVADYFAACTPLPPGWERQRKVGPAWQT